METALFYYTGMIAWILISIVLLTLVILLLKKGWNKIKFNFWIFQWYEFVTMKRIFAGFHKSNEMSWLQYSFCLELKKGFEGTGTESRFKKNIFKSKYIPLLDKVLNSEMARDYRENPNSYGMFN